MILRKLETIINYIRSLKITQFERFTLYFAYYLRKLSYIII